jgi:hypothetical protein
LLARDLRNSIEEEEEEEEEEPWRDTKQNIPRNRSKSEKR